MKLTQAAEFIDYQTNEIEEKNKEIETLKTQLLTTSSPKPVENIPTDKKNYNHINELEIKLAQAAEFIDYQ